MLSGCRSVGSPAPHQHRDPGGLCSHRTVSGPEPSSPPGSLSSGPALGLPPALCLPSTEMEDFFHGSVLCHLTSLLLFTQLPTGGFARECTPPLFLCGFLGAGLVLSIRSGLLFEKVPSLEKLSCFPSQ